MPSLLRLPRPHLPFIPAAISSLSFPAQTLLRRRAPFSSLPRAARLDAPLPAATPAAAAERPAGRPAAPAGVASMLDHRDDAPSHISGYDRWGFTVNGVRLRGSVLVFRNFSLLWHVARVLDVCPRNLAIAHMVKPRPELLLLGTGDRMQNVNPSLYAYFARHGISIEALSTVRARAAAMRAGRRRGGAGAADAAASAPPPPPPLSHTLPPSLSLSSSRTP